jgi:leader peptidase (prepilin peptidase)/N-methyltransferase
VKLIIGIFIFIIGISVGSFLSVVIYRIREGKKGIFLGRSLCLHCKKILSVRDLIPLFSYLFLKGKCRYCLKKITPHYLFLELTAGLVFLFIFLKFPFIVENGTFSNFVLDFQMLAKFLFYLLCSTLFIGIFFYDLQYMEIPDIFLFSLLFITLIGGLVFNGNIIDLLIALGISLVFFGGQILLSKGKWLGEGDLYLGLSMAFLLGWKLLLIAIILTYLLGAFVSVFLIIGKHLKGKSKVPFAPFMVMGSFATLFIGEQLLQWYLTFLNV